MASHSAGILLHRTRDGVAQVLLVHPGGPYWARKDEGAWSIPKGEYEEGENPRLCALREFEEELGVAPPAAAELRELGSVRLRSGKQVSAWAARGDLDTEAIRSNTFTLEWPPRSGKQQEFPEVDRAGWFGLDEARRKLNPAQAAFIDNLCGLLTLASSGERLE
jgi:predicted NUDIX family NTP pyrophosphohydrolase